MIMANQSKQPGQIDMVKVNKYVGYDSDQLNVS